MRTTMLVVTTLLVLGVGVAAAEEIVFFTNGTSMPVRAHEIDGEMIRVDLGQDGWLAFPQTQVERIEEAGREVFPRQGGAANRIVEGERSYPVRGRRTGRHSRPSGSTTGEPVDPAVGTDANGIPIYRPMFDSTNPAARRIGATGHPAVLGGDADAPGGKAKGPRRPNIPGGRYDKTGQANSGKPKVTGVTRAPGAGARPGRSSGGSSGASGGTSDGDDN